MAGKPEIDPATGTETTGHEWDGIRELNTPLPRWWLWTFYATIAWAVAYVIAMPAIPLIGSYTKGLLGWSSRGTLQAEMAAAAGEQQVWIERIAQSSLDQIAADPQLAAFAAAGGRSAFAVNCSQCHGSGAAGSAGYPNLNDDEWLWGGTLADVHHSIAVGIRSGHPEARQNVMAAYLRDGILTPAEVGDVAEYVLSLAGHAQNAAAAERGRGVFEQQCVACHQEGGIGSHELGAPSLADGIWLYGGDKASIIRSVSYGRSGVMPAWQGRLDDETLKMLAVYVHGLGGGE